MPTRLLSRRRPRPTEVISPVPALTLTAGRVHEATGPSRHVFALILAARTDGPVIWIAPSWSGERLHAEGAAGFLDPGRLLFLSPSRTEDLLWTMEEALRSGAAAFVAAELPEPPGLTPVRRLHLAAEAGAAASGRAPFGILLTPADGGAAGVESRWHLAPQHGAGRTAWRVERRRARSEPPRAWTLRREGDSLSLEG